MMQIEGMDCSTCANTIRSYLEKQGLQDVQVDYAGGMARFSSDKEVSFEEIGKGLSGLGYKLVDASKPEEKTRYNPLLIKLIISGLFTIPLLLHMFLSWELMHHPTFQLLCALPVMIIGLFHFGKNAFNALRVGVFHMDLLIVIGSSAAFVYSLIGVFYLNSHRYLFFETTASIITLVLLGNYLEHYAVEQTRKSLAQLQRIRPQKALRINFYGMGKFEQTEEIEASKLLPTDVVLIRNGDVIPVDGEVLWGEGDVSESIINGESIPVHKTLHSEVLAGTTLVNGSLKVRVKKLGEDTTLSAIIRLMKNTQARKVSMQRLADRITGIFVPTVITISALTFIINYFVAHIDGTNSLMRSIAVLVISCPCAMGLATPTAIMVGIGFAARKGILFKDASVIETIPQVKQIIFDKTGTLTTGSFTLSRIETNGLSEEEFKQILYSLEKHSSHPIAQSIVKAFAGTEELTFKHIQEIAGKGMHATDEVGNDYMAQGFYDEGTGTYGVELLRNGSPAGKVIMNDELRKHIPEVIAQLHQNSYETYIISGDKESRVQAMARQLGIKHYLAEQKPDDKLRNIEQLKSKGKVLMIGDGINDAPALAAADVGVSLAAQNGITTDAAQIVLLNNKIEALKDVIGISKVTYSTIKQNLFWAFFYNVIAIPLAAAGFLTPIIGAAAMACSDLVVIGNSLLLRYKRLR